MAGLRGGPWLAANATASRVALQVNSSRLIYAACVAGLGVAILPCFGADLDPALVCLVPPEQVQTFDLWLVVHRDLRQRRGSEPRSSFWRRSGRGFRDSALWPTPAGTDGHAIRSRRVLRRPAAGLISIRPTAKPGPEGGEHRIQTWPM